ncbi:hypothetical protein BD309DRAFT_153090 [Dichomitus squalens]|nr:hypothetical protein BD309DRAFT_153090 [Dichomitus squalens]
MATETAQYARIQNRDSVVSDAPTSSPRSLRRRVSHALSSFTGRSPENSTVVPPVPPTNELARPATRIEKATSRMASGADQRPENALKRTWSRGIHLARTRSEPALHAKRAKTSASATAPAVPALPRAATTTVAGHSRDMGAYASTESAIVSYTYPLWRIDPVLVGCFVCL